MSLIDKIAKGGLGGIYAEHVLPGTVGPVAPAKPFAEVGVTGLLRTRGIGYVYDEWLANLSTYRQRYVYREMRDNDAVIGSMFFALEMILRKAEWRVDPAPGRKGQQYAEFIHSCMEDQSHTWEDFIAENVSMFAFGFSLFETVYKRRNGPDGRKASRFDDGLIGWRKMAPRAQESILYWIWDDAGGLQGAVQLAAPDYHTVPIPIEKLLLFRTTSLKNSPEGRSVLRNVYRSWFFKRRIEEVEGIGIERDLCGIPVLYASAEALEAMGGTTAAQQLVTNIRMDDQMGVILPLAYDDNKNPLVKLELLKSGGAKQTNAGETISRYNADILNTMLAGFVQFGQSPTGSRSLHMSATQIFSLAIGAFMDSIAAVMNRIAIPRLMRLNKMDLQFAPKLMAGEIGVRDLEELSTFIQQLSMAGFQFFDKRTQNAVRKVGRLPPLPDDDEDNRPPVPDASAPQDQTGAMPDPVRGATPKTQQDLDQPGAKVPGAVSAVPRTRAVGSQPAGV